ANREAVTLNLWPFFGQISLPLFAALSGALYIGFILGAAVAWWAGRRTRSTARREARQAAQLTRENADLRARIDTLPPRSGGVLPAPPAP
ncbi:MAG: LapA family protein, partial [Rhodospirillales bacterium]|nr:LapA family protein [Rhodospirillales bacterium]